MGRNFTSGSRVWVGGRIASTTYVSSMQLSAITPAGTAAGLTHVSVTTPDRATVTRNSAFTYTTTTSSTSPDFDSISPTSGPLAGGTRVTVRGRNFTTGSRVWVGGRIASTTYVSSTQLNATTPAGAAVGLTHVSVTTPDRTTVTRGNAFTYTGTTASETAADTTLADASTFSMEADGVSPETMAAASAVDAQAAIPESTASARYLPIDASATGADTRLALTNAGDAPTTATLTFTDDKGAATRLPVELAARQRRTLDARSAPALRRPVSVALDASAHVVLERLTVARDQGASSLTTAVEAKATWAFAAGSTAAPFELGFVIENPGAADASVEAQFLRSDAEPVIARYAVKAGSRVVVDVAREQPALAGASVAATFAAPDATPVVVTRLMASESRGATRIGEVSAGAASSATSWRTAGDTTGAALVLAIANPGTEAALVEATYTNAAGALVMRRYDVGARRLATIDVAAEDAALRDTSVDVRVEVLNGAPVVVERSQWWRGRNGSMEGLANTGSPEPAARWLFAEGEDGGADEALTTLRLSNVSTQAVEARVTALVEGGESASATVTVGAGESLATPLTKLIAAAAGRRFSVLVEAVDGSASLVAEQRLFHRTRDGRVMGSATSAVSIP
jgi:hypothetical protein